MRKDTDKSYRPSPDPERKTARALVLGKTFTGTISLAALLGLMMACSGHHPEPQHYSTVVLNPAGTVKGIQGVISTNASGQKLIGDVALYSNNSTKIIIDGIQASSSDLQPGMIIEAEGELASDNRFNCTSIASDSLLTGKVESIDLASKTLKVAGQTVIVDDKSYLAKANGHGNGHHGQGNNYSHHSFDGFQVGDHVTVCGFVHEETGHHMATRISLWSSTDSATTATYTVQGTISDLTSTTFKVGNHTVHHGNAAITGTVANGHHAVAYCHWVNGDLYADRITSQAPVANTNVQSVYGTVSNWDQYGHCFQLGGRGGCCGGICYWVYYDDEYTPLLASLGANANVRVEGVVTKTGNTYKIQATKISK